MRRFLSVPLSLALFAASAAAGDAFEVTTPGVPGTAGLVPTLAAQGPATPGSRNLLSVTDAPPVTPTLLVFGASELAAPFAGGVLGPAPQFLAQLAPTDARGRLEHRFRMPPAAPAGLQLWLQCWFSDAGASAGVAASNTLRATVQAELPTALLFPTPLVGTGNNVVLLADFDEDGSPDLLAPQYATGGLQELALQRGCGDGSFGAASTTPIPEPAFVRTLDSADLDLDGHLDVVVAASGPMLEGRLLTFLGDGSGVLNLALDEDLPAVPGALALGDVDTDGAVDLVIAALSTGSVVFRPGLGNGDFGPATVLAQDTQALALDLVDVDLDGALDLLYFDSGQERLLVRLGEGDGDFAAPTVAVAGLTLSAFEVDDLDQDGLPDIAAVVTSSPSSLAVLRGLGGGDFAAPTLQALGTDTAYPLWLGDLDGNGTTDALVGGSEDPFLEQAEVEILLGTGDGGFAPQTPRLRVGELGALHVADLDDDAFPDLVTARFSRPPVVFRGSGPAEFLAPNRYGVGTEPRGLLLDDLDGDDAVDLVVVRNGTLVTRRGDGNGAFEPQVETALAQGGSRARSGPLDAVPGPELVVWFPDALLPNKASRFSVLRNDGAGGLTETQIVNAGAGIAQLRLGDVDADGALDVFGSFSPPGAAWVAFGDGLGGVSSVDELMLGPGILDVALADVTGDGVDDLLTLRDLGGTHLGPRRLRLHAGLGGGDYAAPESLGEGTPLRGPILIDDLDLDGTLDVLVNGRLDDAGPIGTVAWLGLGAGDFAAPVASGMEEVTQLADLTGDGLPDGLALDSFGDFLVLSPGLGDGTFAPPTWFATGRDPTGLDVADLDGDGHPDVVTCHREANNVYVFRNQREE